MLILNALLNLEDLRGYTILRGYTDIFTKNIMNTKDFTYHKLKSMTIYIDIVVLKGGKDSSLVIMDQQGLCQKVRRNY